MVSNKSLKQKRCRYQFSFGYNFVVQLTNETIRENSTLKKEEEEEKEASKEEEYNESLFNILVYSTANYCQARRKRR